MRHLTRRAVLAAAATAFALGAAALAPGARAADYPDRPITMLVGYGAGGQTDLVARAAAKVLSDQLGVPVNVVNKPGAGGGVAARDLTREKPDGYTILFHANSIVNSLPFVMPRVSFTPEDFEYAGMITSYQVGLAAPKDAPYDTLEEFVAWAKENPGFAYGSLSPTARIIIEEISKKEGLDANIVPLQSGSEMINALLGKQVALAFSGGIHYRYPDELKSIAALTTFSHPSAPGVKSIDESGYKLAMDSRTTIFAPKGTPREALDRLGEALSAAETDPQFKKVAASANIPIMHLGVDAAYEEMRESTRNNRAIYEAAGVLRD